MCVQTIPKMQYYTDIKTNDTKKLFALIKKYPSYPDAYLLLAEKYKNTSPDEAAIFYKKAAEIVNNPNFTAAMDENIASMYMNAGNIIYAAKYYSNPTLIKYNIGANLMLANILTICGRFDQAIDVLDKFEKNTFLPVLSSEPDTFIRMRYELFYKIMSLVDDGSSSKNAVLQAKANVYYRKGEYDRALNLLNQYMMASGNIPVSLLLKIYVAKGDLYSAKKYYIMLDKYGKNTGTMDDFSKGLYSLAINDYSNANNTFSRMVQKVNAASAGKVYREEYGWYGLGLLNMQNKNYKEAANCFNKALEILPYSYNTSVKLAECYRKIGDLKNYNKYNHKIKALLTF